MTKALIVTSIAHPTKAMKKLAASARTHGFNFYCIGDSKSPHNFSLENCLFLGLRQQGNLPFQIVGNIPVGHYSRKNIGYLIAINMGADRIVETDDDNTPLETFWLPRQSYLDADLICASPWVNAYAFFTDNVVWPRGFPLERILEWSSERLPSVVRGKYQCPIQQGFANGDTDVDAIYRLTKNETIEFRRREPIVLDVGSWCPFNSQSTFWWPRAYPLMYLPSYCSFRMTDIWRSFVAQACLWADGCRVAFIGPTMHQNRNQHNILEDFQQELDGYLNTLKVSNALMDLDLRPGGDQRLDNLLKCYRCLAKLGIVEMRELRLLDDWIADLSRERKVVL